ncbi:MAG: hypothetical protein ACTSXQ_05320 [Alphaproteobacteria bacterium]
MFSAAGVEELNKAYLEIKWEHYAVLLKKAPSLNKILKEESARKYLEKGFLRRLETLYGCILNIGADT